MKLILIYRPVEGERLSQPGHCSRREVIFVINTESSLQCGYDPRSQASMLPLDHCNVFIVLKTSLNRGHTRLCGLSKVETKQQQQQQWKRYLRREARSQR